MATVRGSGATVEHGGGSLSDRAFAWLADQMLRGDLQPGQWVSENDLAAQLGVSRMPVREALRMLARDGLVVVLPRRGTVIAEFDDDDIRHTYEARKLIAAQMLRDAVPALRPADLRRLEAIVKRVVDAGDDMRAAYRTAEQIWAVLVPRCANPVIGELDALLRRRCILFRGTIAASPDVHAAMLRCHERLLAAFRAGSGDAAAAAITEFLDAIQQQLLGIDPRAAVS